MPGTMSKSQKISKSQAIHKSQAVKKKTGAFKRMERQLGKQLKKVLECPMNLLGNTLVHALELRIPTAHKSITKSRKLKVMGILKPGDIILTTDPAYLLWETFEYALAKSHFTHAMVYEGYGQVLEATIESGDASVLRWPLEDHLQGAVRLAIVRPNYKPGDVHRVLEYCRAQLGKPYDDLFDIDHENDEKFYCSSLMYWALKQLPEPIEVEATPMYGRHVVIPDAFLHLPEARIMYADKFNLWTNAGGAAPTLMGAAAGAAALHLVVPHLAILGGFYLAVSAGNKIQTGHFGLTGG